MQDNKKEHLNLIQSNISRLASNSFITKEWTITTIGAAYAYWLGHRSSYLLWIILGLTLLFWYHDAYYLHQERRFRDLYDEVRLKDEEEIDFSMKCPETKETVWEVMLCRPILRNTYGLFSISTLVLLYITK